MTLVLTIASMIVELSFSLIDSSPSWIGQNARRQVTLPEIDELASALFESVDHAERAVHTQF